MMFRHRRPPSWNLDPTFSLLTLPLHVLGNSGITWHDEEPPFLLATLKIISRDVTPNAKFTTRVSNHHDATCNLWRSGYRV